MEKRKTICPLDCPDACGLIATVQEGKILKLEGDPEHEITRGFICRKMKSYPKRVESPDRILHPMLRTGPKGTGAFKQISWDKAWEILVEMLSKLKAEYGGETLLPYSYAGNMGHISANAGMPFFNKYGASRLGKTICSATAKTGWRAHMGACPGADPSKAADSTLVIAWGINVKVTNVHFWPMIQQCRRKGGKFLVIDPYKNITGKAADFYFPVKPGGDATLALGALKYIIDQDKQNHQFIDEKTTGFKELKQYITEASWQEIERDSGISQDKIAVLANILIENPKTFIRIGIGLSRNSRGAMSVRAIVCLALALGLFEDKPDAGVLLSSGAYQTDSEKLEYSSLSEKETRIINMVQLGRALTSLSPRVYGLFVYNSNPLSVAPEASMVKKGLEREDLFTVVHEQLMTPTARYADLILPATTFLEHRDVYLAYGHFHLGLTEQVIRPKGETIDNFTLFQTLAQKMGYDDAPFRQSLEERLQDYLSGITGIPSSVNINQLAVGEYVQSVNVDSNNYQKKYLPFRFVSDSLSPDQSAIPCLGLLAEFENPELLAQFPLKLITPPTGDLLNSTFGDLFPEEPGILLIHPDDAACRNIKDEDRVEVFNQRGSIFRRAKITKDTQLGLVVAEGIYWENPDLKIYGVNELTSQETADLGGGGTFHESLVEVSLV